MANRYFYKTKAGEASVDLTTVIRGGGVSTSPLYKGFTYVHTTYANSATGKISGYGGMPVNMACPPASAYAAAIDLPVPGQALYATVVGRGGGGQRGGGGGSAWNRKYGDSWANGGAGGYGAGGAYAYKKFDLTSTGTKTLEITIGRGGTNVGGGGGGSSGYGDTVQGAAGQKGEDGVATTVTLKINNTPTGQVLTAPGGTGGGGGGGADAYWSQSGFIDYKQGGGGTGYTHQFVGQTDWEPNTTVENAAAGGTDGGGGGGSNGNNAPGGAKGGDGKAGAVSVMWIYGSPP